MLALMGGAFAAGVAVGMPNSDQLPMSTIAYRLLMGSLSFSVGPLVAYANRQPSRIPVLFLMSALGFALSAATILNKLPL